MKKATLTLFAIGFALLVLGGALPAGAQVSCGDVITVNTILVATDPIVAGPCPGFPDPDALTVQGPATLDMNGFTISCADTTIHGITVLGSGATIENGTVTGCQAGVLLNGGSSHRIVAVLAKSNVNGFHANAPGKNRVSNCIAEGNTIDGFVFQSGSSRNTFEQNIALNNGNDGYFMGNPDPALSASNKFTRNAAVNNGGNGWDFYGGSNKFTGNLASGNGLAGFTMALGTGTGRDKFRDNTALDNSGGNGFSFGQGDKLILQRNKAIGNNNAGVQFGGGGTVTNAKVKGNMLAINGSSGIFVFGSGNSAKVGGNLVTGNNGAGIELSAGVSASSVKGNVVVTNDIGGGFADMVDQNPTCGSNTWNANVFGNSLVNFGTGDQSCIQ